MSVKLASIVCNGRPINSSLLRRHVESSDIVIAADAGILYLEEIGLRPDVFIGDLDSLDTPAEKIDADEIIIYDSEKDHSDSEIAVEYAFSKAADRVLLLCAAGRRTDHLLSNIALLTRYPGRLVMIDDEYVVFALDDDIRSLRLKTKIGASFSVFSYGGEVTGLNERGSRWELENVTLTPGSLGLSNEAASEEVLISIESGSLVVFAECDVGDIDLNLKASDE